MPVALRIVDESEYGPEPRDITVPDGAIITMRRHQQGADVVVEPGKAEAQPEARSWPDIKVPGMCDQCGAWVGLGSPSAPGRPDLRDMGSAFLDAARARLINADAELKELEVAAMKRPPSDSLFQAERWSLVSDSSQQTVILTARNTQGQEIRVETAVERIPWLAEHLLAAKRQVDAESH